MAKKRLYNGGECGIILPSSGLTKGSIFLWTIDKRRLFAMIYHNLYEIFGKCFPMLKMGEDTFKELCEIEECAVFTVKSGDEIVGFAMTRDNEIRLICVEPEYQRQGFGRTLLELAEGAVKDRSSEVTAGSPGSRLFIGAPEETAGFFERFGYNLKGTFAEMTGDTAALVQPEHEPKGNVRFEFRAADTDIINAVREVEDDWAQYFGEGEIFCGVCGDEIASFCIVEEDVTCLLSGDGARVGSIGCVGTVPKFRRRGIGLKMVSLAAEELKKRGCDKIFIHYTHVYDWYAKLGFRPFLKLKMGGKNSEEYRG